MTHQTEADLAAGLVAAQNQIVGLRRLLEHAARRHQQFEALTVSGLKAFEMTRRYVGEERLPAEAGWDWFEWCETARAALDGDEQIIDLG